MIEVETCDKVLTEVSPIEHVKDTSRGPHHHVGCLCLELLHFIADIGASNAGMAGSAHVVPESYDHLLDLMHKQTN